MRQTLVTLGIVLSTISCQKKSENPPAPDYRDNVVGTYYDTRFIININTTSLQSLAASIPAASVLGTFATNTTLSIGNFNSQFRAVKDPSDGAKLNFVDSTNATLFYGNNFAPNNAITTFYIPSQSLNASIISALSAIPSISGFLQGNPVTIKGNPNFNLNGIGYDGFYNSGNKLLTAYGKAQLNLNIGIPVSIEDVVTVTILGYKK